MLELYECKRYRYDAVVRYRGEGEPKNVVHGTI